jgi:hypothetical protein
VDYWKCRCLATLALGSFLRNPRSHVGKGEKEMIVEYDKENGMTYIGKEINGRWVQLGLTVDEVKQIANASREKHDTGNYIGFAQGDPIQRLDNTGFAQGDPIQKLG